MRLIEGGQRPCLRPEPDLVAFGPGLFGAAEPTAVTEQEFREPVAAAQEIGPNVFTTAEEIAGGFFLLGRNVNGGERAGPIEHGKVTGVTAVGFDAIAGPARNERRG